MNVQEGLEVAGESAAPTGAPDPNTDAGFDAILASKVSREASPQEPTPTRDSERAPNPATQSAAEIRAEVAAPDLTTNVKSGLTFTDPTAKRPQTSPTLHTHVVEGQRIVEAEQAHTTAAMQELAARRFAEAFGNAETEEEEVAAALRLQAEAPEVYAEVITQLDSDALDQWQPDWEDEPEDEDLPGNQLARGVDNLKAVLHAHNTAEQYQKLRDYVRTEQAKVALETYRAEGITDLAEVQAQTLRDFAALEAMGLRPLELNPEDLREELERQVATRAVVARKRREMAFKADLLSADSGSVADGLATVGPDGQLVSLQPRPDLTPSVETMAQAIEAEVKARNTHARPSAERVRELKASLLEPERTSWRNGLTQNGKPVEAEVATGERERFRRQRAEEHARIRSFI